MSFRKRRRRNDSGGMSSNTGMMMNLSLFIMMLAFFIVLNSLSTYEELRAEKVRRSIELAFSKETEIKEEKPSTTPEPAQSMREGHTFDRLDALFKSEIASFEPTTSKSRGIMMVKIPYADFEKAVMAPNQKDLTKYPSRRDIRGNFFLPTLVSLMRTSIDGAPTRMEMLLQVKGNPAEIQNVDPEEMTKIIRNIGRFSSKLESQNMPQKLLNIGVTEGDPEFVQLVFKKYVPFSPVETKDENLLQEED